MPMSGCAVPGCSWTYSKSKYTGKRTIFKVLKPCNAKDPEDMEILYKFITNLRGHDEEFLESIDKQK